MILLPTTYALTPRPYRNISAAQGFSYLIGARIETTTRPIMISPVTKTDHNSALGCSSPSMRRGIMLAAIIAAFATCGLSFAPAVFAQSDPLGELLVGKAAFGDWRTDAPLVRRKITELPPPYATRSVANPPRVIARPVSAAPKVPPGFQVELFASDSRLENQASSRV
jgi:hypothetical protein